MSNGTDALLFDHVFARYDEDSLADSFVLSDLTFALRDRPHMSVLVGPNGSGKTTILKVITGQLRATSGRVFLGGIDVNRLPTYRRVGLACVFQRAIEGMCPSLTIEENLSLMFTKASPSLKLPMVTRERTHTILDSARRIGLDSESSSHFMANLESVLLRYPNEFSGGETQQLSLLAILIQEPPPVLVLADEPTLNLDRQNRSACLHLLAKLATRSVVLVATHDNEIVEMGSSRIEIDQGRLTNVSH